MIRRENQMSILELNRFTNRSQYHVEKLVIVAANLLGSLFIVILSEIIDQCIVNHMRQNNFVD